MNKFKLLMYKLILNTICFCCFVIGRVSANEGSKLQEKTLSSPNEKIKVRFYQKVDEQDKHAMYYTLSYEGQVIIEESVLDIQLDNHLSEQAMALTVDKQTKWCDDLEILGEERTEVNEPWNPIYGERNVIQNNYRALIIHIQKKGNPIYKMDVEMRLYDSGLALRYFFPENEKGTYYNVVSENTEFSLPVGTKAWYAGWAQAPYQLSDLKDWKDQSERPLTLQLPNGWYACLAEAGMVDYARTKFKLSNEKPHTLLTAMHGAADLISPVGTPWRVIMVAKTAGELVENNDIILNLNEPSKIANPSWIKPGKIMRIMKQTTADAKAYIDLASKYNLQYVLFDWLWYGPAFTFESDATEVVAPLDMPGIIQYGQSKNVGLWLYVNQQALLAQSDSLYRVYHDWGVKGVKFGFVQTGSHRWTTWLQEQLRKTAENKIMVNIHDEYRPTGEQRTWPNFLTAEGIRGNEEMPDARHNTVLPFTRMMAGAGDYTICYFDKRIKTTHAHQLALNVVMYSALQTVFWYDNPSLFDNEPELEFFAKVPTVWDESHILQGEPGKLVTIARRKGEDWFVGAITNNDGREVSINFDFLPKGRKYTAVIYEDDERVKTKTQVGIRKIKVEAGKDVKLKLKPSGGVAIHVQPLI